VQQPNVIYEVANEYTHGSCGSYQYNGLPDQFVQDVAKHIRQLDQGHLITLSDQGGNSIPRAVENDRDFDLVNYHISRDANWWRNPWDVFRNNAPKTMNRPQMNDEPIGSDVTDQPGKRSADAKLHRAHAYITAVAGGYLTFHCQLGLAAVPGAQPGQEFLKAYRTFFETVDMRQMVPATDFVLGSGAADTFGCRAGDDEMVVYLKGGDLTKPLNVRLATGNRYSIRVVRPADGSELAMSITSGGDIPVRLPGASDDVVVHMKKQ
jgi:hypothetical protein